jgi:hypothetical protein
MFRQRRDDDAIQRLLARDAGQPMPSQPDPTSAGRSPKQPERRKKACEAAKRTAGVPQPQPANPLHTGGQETAPQNVPRVKRLSALAQKRRRHRINFLIAAVLVIACIFAVVTGAFSSSLAALGDVSDSVYLYFDRSGGYPLSTGITQPLRVEELAGGFVELGKEDVAVYSAYGAKVRAFQPGYARPAIAVGNTRFCVYNRAGTELRIESRTKNLYTKNFSDGILLCAMSQNGTTAVVTKSNRYAAQVEVYDSLFQQVYTWSPTQSEGTPVALSFAADNHRFAAGCLSAKSGQLCTTVYLMDTATTAVGATYAATAGSTILELDWLSPTRLLAVFDDYAAILDPATGAEAARFDYGGSTLESVSVSGKDTALLLSGRSGSRLTVLDDTLSTLADAAVGQASSVSCTRTAAYVLYAAAVREYTLNGVQNWERSFGGSPVTVLDARQTLLFYGTQVGVLSQTGKTLPATGEDAGK